MQQNKTLFFAIIGLAIIVVIGMLSVNLFLGETVREQQQVTVEIVVAPSIKEWVEQASEKFNKNNKDIKVKIVVAETLIPKTQPVAWLAEATFIIDLAKTKNSSLQFDNTQSQSIASTSLAWGGFKTKEFEQLGKLNWNIIHQQAVQANSNFKLIIASPNNSAEGLAALISATAAHLDKKTLSEKDVDSAKIWLTETFKESVRGSLLLYKPAEAYAIRKGSIGNAGILTLSSWHIAGLQNNPDDFSISLAQINVTLDYPFAIRTDAKSSPEGKAAATFRDFLLEDTQQNELATFFLNPAATNSDTVQIDGQAVLSLLRWAEQELR